MKKLGGICFLILALGVFGCGEFATTDNENDKDKQPSQVAKPVFSPEAGVFDVSEGVDVSISTETEGAVIFYHTGDTNWTEYTEAIALTETAVLYAKATKSGMDESAIAQATYTEGHKHLFVFKPSTDNFRGSEFREVYLSGSFNGWGRNEVMTYNEAEEQYEVERVVPVGESIYKFRVDWSGNANQDLWFADRYASDYEPDGYYGLNSKITIPFDEPPIYEINYIITNVEVTEAVLWINKDSCWQYLDAANFIEGKEYSGVIKISEKAEDFLVTWELYDTENWGNLEIEKYRYAWFTITNGLSGSTNLAPIGLAYDNLSLSPTNAATVPKNNIDFSWDLPTNLGDLKEIRIWLENKSDWIKNWETNLGPDVDSFNFTGDDDIVAGNHYWGVDFFMESGWTARSRFPEITLTN